MLLLTRKAGEKFHIGDDITVVIVSVRGTKVRVGIDAPRDIYVRRDELPPRPSGGTPNGGSSNES